MDLIIIIASLIVFIAFFVRGITGFANSLILVPLLSLFLDIKMVVPVAAILSIASGIYLFRITREKIEKEFVFVLFFLMIGTLIGTHFLVSYGSGHLEKVLGIVVILFSVQTFFGGTFKGIKKWWGAVAGLAGGVLGGMFTANGPPLVIYFGNKLKKQSFRATLNVIFLIDAVWLNALYVFTGVTTQDTFMFALPLLPALVVALYLGSKMHVRVKEILFKRIVAAILFVVGVAFVL